MGTLSEARRVAEGESPGTRLLESGRWVTVTEALERAEAAAAMELRGKRYGRVEVLSCASDVVADIWRLHAPRFKVFAAHRDYVPTEKVRMTYLRWRCRDWRERDESHGEALAEDVQRMPVSLAAEAQDRPTAAPNLEGEALADIRSAWRASVEIAEGLELPAASVYAIHHWVSGHTLERLAEDWSCDYSAAKQRAKRGSDAIRSVFTADEFCAALLWWQDTGRPARKRSHSMSPDWREAQTQNAPLDIGGNARARMTPNGWRLSGAQVVAYLDIAETALAQGLWIPCR